VPNSPFNVSRRTVAAYGNDGNDTFTISGPLGAATRLNGGAGSNVYTVGGYTGGGVLTLTGGGSDTVNATRNANFTLTNTRLSIGARNITLSGIGTANLTGGTSNNTFTVTGWTGAGSLTGGGGAARVILVTADADITLTNTSLVSGTTNLTLAGITLDTLTVNNNAASRTIDASAFTGSSTLTATGSTKATLIGGSGADTLTINGTGNGIMLGGAGNDTLRATGSGRTLLIGGTGADALSSSSNGQAIMIGGSTSYDSNVAARDAVLAEWASGNPYATRVADILAGTGLTNGNALTGTTVLDDGVRDTLTGPTGNGAARNWFLKKLGTTDAVTKRSTETLTQF
jgi:hypothetical protein